VITSRSQKENEEEEKITGELERLQDKKVKRKEDGKTAKRRQPNYRRRLPGLPDAPEGVGAPLLLLVKGISYFC
jgi:hypothetical protein